MPDPIDVDPFRQRLAEEAARTPPQNAGATVGNLIDGADIVGDVVQMAAISADTTGAVFETVTSAAEVSGHVLSGAFDALGSAGDLLGCLDGCSGCSVAIAFVIALASAGAAVAGSFF